MSSHDVGLAFLGHPIYELPFWNYQLLFCVSFVQLLSAYLEYMTDIGVLLGGTRSRRDVISQRMQEVIEFEQAIAKVVCITWSALDIIQSSYYIHGPLGDENIFAVLYVSLCYGPYTLL